MMNRDAGPARSMDQFVVPRRSVLPLGVPHELVRIEIHRAEFTGGVPPA